MTYAAAISASGFIGGKTLIFTWINSLLYGLFSGLADILPISASAHKVLLLKFFGVRETPALMELLIHAAVFAALYYSAQSHMIRINRARALARIPKEKRKRPLDLRSLMDWSMMKTIAVPAILGLYLYQYTRSMGSNLILVALFLFVNGIVLYVPQYFPASNKDSRTLSRVEGLLMGLGGMASILPGISAMGAALSIGSVAGVEKKFALTMALMMNMVLNIGFIVYDVLGIMSAGLGALSFGILLRYIVTAAVAFGGTVAAIRIMGYMSEKHGYSVFGIYCWGLAMFTFVLNLIA